MTDIDFNNHFDAAAPTPRQMKYIHDLRAGWMDAMDEIHRINGTVFVPPNWVDPTFFDEASAMIDKGAAARDEAREMLRTVRRHRLLKAQEAVKEITEGLYVIYVIGHPHAGAVFKVQAGATGWLYAKVLTVNGWQYDGRKSFALIAAEGHSMTAEEAAYLGTDADSPLRGECVNCGIALTDETSMYYGYGEICAGHHGWPYIKGAERF